MYLCQYTVNFYILKMNIKKSYEALIKVLWLYKETKRKRIMTDNKDEIKHSLFDAMNIIAADKVNI